MKAVLVLLCLFIWTSYQSASGTKRYNAELSYRGGAKKSKVFHFHSGLLMLLNFVKVCV